MTEQQHPYNDDFFRLWEREIDNVEEHVYNTNEMLFERMRAIFALVKSTQLDRQETALVVLLFVKLCSASCNV